MGQAINKQEFEEMQQSRDEFSRLFNIEKLKEKRSDEMEKAFIEKQGSRSLTDVSFKEFLDFRREYFSKNEIKYTPD